MNENRKSKYPGGTTRLIADIFIYITSSVFILLCGLFRIIIEIIIFPIKILMMKRRKIILSVSFILFALFGAYYYLAVMPAGTFMTEEDTSIIIHKGETLSLAAEKLKKKAIIGSSALLVRLVSVVGSEKDIKAGKYDFKTHRSYFSIGRLLLKGSNSPIKVTFPEGLAFRQMAGMVYDKLKVDSTDFLDACRDKTIIESYRIKANNLEGYLFPDTYNFYYNTDAFTIVKAMVDRFFTVFDDSMKARAKKYNLSVHQAVTLASLIEKETGRFDERNLISAVFHNRLSLGMRLQCDPTILYTLPDLNRPLMFRDLEIKSPYNTYLYYGLPPGPIANPGKKSLEAALNPSEAPYLYFVATGEGGHLFASSNRQHNNNRIKIKRKLRTTR